MTDDLCRPTAGSDLSNEAPTLEALVKRALDLISRRRLTVLGVAGPPGAGKTTLVEALLSKLHRSHPAGLESDAWLAHVPLDGFHLADAELRRLGRLAHKGAPDTFDVAGYVALLRRLRRGDDPVVYAPSFERVLEQPIAGSIPVPSTVRLVLTEGNYLLLQRGPWNAVATELDECWYCHTTDELRVQRLIDRHVRFGKREDEARAWVNGVDEHNTRTVAATASRADIVVDLSAGLISTQPSRMIVRGHR
jgi:pantothenate kinase